MPKCFYKWSYTHSPLISGQGPIQSWAVSEQQCIPSKPMKMLEVLHRLSCLTSPMLTSVESQFCFITNSYDRIFTDFLFRCGFWPAAKRCHMGKEFKGRRLLMTVSRNLISLLSVVCLGLLKASHKSFLAQ